MTSRTFFSSLFVALLVVALAVPSVFLVTPRTAYAQVAVPVGDAFNLIKNTLTAAATVAEQVNTYVLQPLAFVLSGNLLKLITAGVIDFVIGKTNGTGAPQFVQDLQGNLQRVGDIQANAFFIQFGKNSNSPFASAISSSLRTNYLQNTSSAGFFAANRNTLAAYSPNPNAFLAGDWSQGGIGAWFALTTQTQNNPYTLYQASQSHLASIVGSAVSARLEELGWGEGFLSWCGANDPTASSEVGPPVSVGVNPGDPCFTSDGTRGTIKTPGSTIEAIFDEALVLDWKKLIEMGSVAKEINGILGNVGKVLGTVQFASQLLGGPGSGGLFGVGQTSGINSTSRLLEYQSPGYLGVTPSTVLQNAATLPVSGPDMLSRVAQYESAWNTIRSAANSASTTVASLASFCTTAATNSPNIASVATTQASNARSAITTQIAPVIAQADAAATVIASARAMVQKIQITLNSDSVGAGNASFADIETLQAMPPSDSDVISTQQNTQVFNMATAVPAGSLVVSGGTIIDRLSLISTNAEALKASVCTELVQTNNNNGSSNNGGS